MNNTNKKMNVFSRVYKRASKSPFFDHGTVLWLACFINKTEDEITLNYDRYIYLHRATNGSICGISVSKKLLEDNPDFEDMQYMEGTLMYAFLLLHIEEICAFCEHFRDEFIELFLIPPLDYFSVAEKYWLQKISDA